MLASWYAIIRGLVAVVQEAEKKQAAGQAYRAYVSNVCVDPRLHRKVHTGAWVVGAPTSVEGGAARVAVVMPRASLRGPRVFFF